MLLDMFSPLTVRMLIDVASRSLKQPLLLLSATSSTGLGIMSSLTSPNTRLQ